MGSSLDLLEFMWLYRQISFVSLFQKLLVLYEKNARHLPSEDFVLLRASCVWVCEPEDQVQQKAIHVDLEHEHDHVDELVEVEYFD